MAQAVHSRVQGRDRPLARRPEAGCEAIHASRGCRLGGGQRRLQREGVRCGYEQRTDTRRQDDEKVERTTKGANSEGYSRYGGRTTEEKRSLSSSTTGMLRLKTGTPPRIRANKRSSRNTLLSRERGA